MKTHRISRLPAIKPAPSTSRSCRTMRRCSPRRRAEESLCLKSPLPASIIVICMTSPTAMRRFAAGAVLLKLPPNPSCRTCDTADATAASISTTTKPWLGSSTTTKPWLGSLFDEFSTSATVGPLAGSIEQPVAANAHNIAIGKQIDERIHDPLSTKHHRRRRRGKFAVNRTFSSIPMSMVPSTLSFNDVIWFGASHPVAHDVSAVSAAVLHQGRRGAVSLLAHPGAAVQLHALAYNFGNFLRTLATTEPIKDWSMTSL